MKLSKSELNALEQAAAKDTYDNRLAYSGYSTGLGWFTPQHHESADIHIRHQTCKSLCGKGLLQYRTVKYVKRNGAWSPVNEYRVSTGGIEYLEALGGE